MHLTTPTRTVTRCVVCGFAEVRTDQVVDRGLVMLSECPRCEHRSTWRVPGLELQRVIWPDRQLGHQPERAGPVRVAPHTEEETEAA